jgi:hypothetical protein
MARRYGSFLIRCWALGGGELRLEIEHIQSGDRQQTTSLTDGLAWIKARASQFDRTSSATPAEPGDCEGEVMNSDDT